MKTLDLSWLEAFRTDQPHFGLERMEKLLALRDKPQLTLPVIHIAGTNGKGSTIAHLRQLLQALGLKVGVFSSPYLIDYRDQLTINGQAIPETDLLALFDSYRPLLLEHQADLLGLTEFEIITAMSFDYFHQQAVDIAILEVGMGGRLDSTNVCQPLLTAITTIGLDHVALLGDTLEKIAEQKAGIIKDQIPVVLGKIAPSAVAVIGQIAQEKAAPVSLYQEDYQLQALDSLPDGETFSYQSPLRPSVQLTTPLIGQQQVENAGLALTLLDQYCQLKGLPLLSTSDLQAALDQVRWPGRMEIVSTQPLILIDGAHNPHAMARLVDNLNNRYANIPKDILFACINTKEEATMVRQLKQVKNAQLTLTSFEDSRAIPALRMQELAQAENLDFQDWQAFLKERQNEQHMLVITGSLYFLAQVRPHLVTQETL